MAFEECNITPFYWNQIMWSRISFLKYGHENSIIIHAFYRTLIFIIFQQFKYLVVSFCAIFMNSIHKYFFIVKIPKRIQCAVYILFIENNRAIWNIYYIYEMFIWENQNKFIKLISIVHFLKCLRNVLAGLTLQ